MKPELDGLREEVQRQFDKEREQHREELEHGAALVMELREACYILWRVWPVLVIVKLQVSDMMRERVAREVLLLVGEVLD